MAYILNQGKIIQIRALLGYLAMKQLIMHINIIYKIKNTSFQEKLPCFEEITFQP